VTVGTDLAPVPAPEGLIGDLFLPTPDATWEKARAILGGPAAFLPQSSSALATTLLKLPITVAGEIDGSVPILGAAIKKGTASTFGVIGIHVRSGDRFIDQLTRGAEARFIAKVDEASKIRLLTLSQAAPTEVPSFVLGVLGNYLLVAQKLDDLTAAGSYVARTLPTRTPPKEDIAFEIPEAALAGPVLESVRLSWAGIRNDVDDAKVPITPFAGTMNTALAALADAKQARLTLELESGGAHARFTLTPKPGNGPASKAIAEMVVGDEKPLLDLPATTQVGILFRDAPAARAAEIPDEAAALAKLVGKDEGSAGDREAIAAALRAEAEARGEWVTIGLGLNPAGLGAMAKVAIADEEKMSKALKQFVELTKLPSAKARLKESSLAISASKVVVEDLPGDVQRIRFERIDKDDRAKDDKGKAAKPEASNALLPSAVDLLCLVTKNVLYGAVGSEPKESLRALVKAPEGANLGTIPAIKAMLDALGTEASFTLVGDVRRLVAARTGKSAPEEPAPVVLAIGKTGAEARMFGRLDVSATTLQELVKHRNAFF
jgi:hypothetical protein